MDNRELISKGKRLAYLLRHDESYQFDQHGWREVSDLISNHGFTMEELVCILANNDKQRYKFSDDKKKIRARQGHSVDVDVELRQMTPPSRHYEDGKTTCSLIFDRGYCYQRRSSPWITRRLGCRHKTYEC